jgi:hypothetical protein
MNKELQIVECNVFALTADVGAAIIAMFAQERFVFCLKNDG